MIDPEDPNSGEDDESPHKTNVIVFRLPEIPQPEFTVPDTPIKGGFTVPDTPLIIEDMDPKYAAILESQGWRILDSEDVWEGSSTQQFVAMNVSRIVDSGEIPIPDIEVGGKCFPVISQDNQFDFKSFIETVFGEIAEQLIVNQNPFITIRIPGLTLLAIGNRMKRGAGYDIDKFFEKFISTLCQGLCDMFKFNITADIGTGNIVGNKDGVALFYDYYDVFIRIAGDPRLELVK